MKRLWINRIISVSNRIFILMDRAFRIMRLTEPYVGKLVSAAKVFFAESDYKQADIELDEGAFRILVADYIDNPYVCAVLAVDDEDEVAGFCITYCQKDYTVALIGDLFLFFVLPIWRGTEVARSLAAEAVKQWNIWGCKRVYVEAASGIKDPQHLTVFKNLWAKFGFVQAGIVMKRDM